VCVCGGVLGCVGEGAGGEQCKKARSRLDANGIVRASSKHDNMKQLSCRVYLDLCYTATLSRVKRV